MNYSWQYGSNFSASTDLQTMINGWYVNGTEIVFACGGSMFQSIVPPPPPMTAMLSA